MPGKQRVIPIAAFFDEGLGPNLSAPGDPERELREAEVIVGVDVMSERQFLVFGRDTLKRIRTSGNAEGVRMLSIALDQDTAELEKLLALVQVVKGHHDYSDSDSVADGSCGEVVTHPEIPTMFMFTANGHVQFWGQGDRRGMILAKDHNMARKFALWFEKKKGSRISVAEIGSVEGETLVTQLNASLAEGANCAFVIRTIDDDNIECDIIKLP